MSKHLTPFDTGETLEPMPWPPRYSEPGGSAEDRADFGKVDFDNEEGATLYTVQIVKNDPVPSTGELYTIRITNLADESYIIEQDFDEQRECLRCGDEVQYLNSDDECDGCAALPRCSQCSEVATEFYPNLEEPIQFCRGCEYNAIRSGWEPGK